MKIMNVNLRKIKYPCMRKHFQKKRRILKEAGIGRIRQKIRRSCPDTACNDVKLYAALCCVRTVLCNTVLCSLGSDGKAAGNVSVDYIIYTALFRLYIQFYGFELFFVPAQVIFPYVLRNFYQILR